MEKCVISAAVNKEGSALAVSKNHNLCSLHGCESLCESHHGQDRKQQMFLPRVTEGCISLSKHRRILGWSASDKDVDIQSEVFNVHEAAGHIYLPAPFNHLF